MYPLGIMLSFVYALALRENFDWNLAGFFFSEKGTFQVVCFLKSFKLSIILRLELSALVFDRWLLYCWVIGT